VQSGLPLAPHVRDTPCGNYLPDRIWRAPSPSRATSPSKVRYRPPHVAVPSASVVATNLSPDLLQPTQMVNSPWSSWPVQSVYGRVAVFSCAGHDELRLLRPVLPVMNLLAARSLTLVSFHDCISPRYTNLRAPCGCEC
jgi:hypothetical protein